jgi:hypothetical protein
MGQRIRKVVGNRLVEAHVHGNAKSTDTEIVGNRCFIRGPS